MNAYELYEAAIDNDSSDLSAKNFSDYADGALNIFITSEVAEKISACAINFRDNGDGSNDLYHMVEKPLSEITL